MKVTKVKPAMKIVDKYDADGWHKWQEIEYSCPLCHRILRGWYTSVGCSDCGVFFDWGKKEPTIKVEQRINVEEEPHKEVPQWYKDFMHFDAMFNKKVDS